MDTKKLTDAIVAVIESATQAEYDFCGEQREFHLPRLNRAMVLLIQVFPRESCDAMMKAKHPDGTPLIEE